MNFTDVNEMQNTPDEVHAVDFACHIGAMNGFDDNSFHPHEKISYFIVDSSLSLIFLSNEQHIFYDYPIMRRITCFYMHLSSETPTVSDLEQLLIDLFDPLIVNSCAKNILADKILFRNNTKPSTRLDLALLLHHYCTLFSNNSFKMIFQKNP